VTGRPRDEYAEFDRPRRTSRPRTKRRPRHDDAVDGFVVTIDRGRYTCLVSAEDAGRKAGEGTGGPDLEVLATKARRLGRQSVVVGDRARLVGDVSGTKGSLARIIGVRDRTTVLRRTADDDDPIERVVVANADQLAMVVALADPPPRPRLIDRCLVAAYDAHMDPLLVLTKADLASADALLADYRPLGLTTVVTQREDDPEPLHELLVDRTTVLVGHSGVGKSTLVNALVPGADRSTAEVSEVTGRGRHTSTSAIALPLPWGGWIIDTPGIRSFGLAHVTPERMVEAFDDLAVVTVDCPRGCPHTTGAQECALDEAAADGRIDPARLGSFRRLLDARVGGEDV
jgi:ribosome biogenesis GTPase